TSNAHAYRLFIFKEQQQPTSPLFATPRLTTTRVVCVVFISSEEIDYCLFDLTLSTIWSFCLRDQLPSTTSTQTPATQLTNQPRNPPAATSVASGISSQAPSEAEPEIITEMNSGSQEERKKSFWLPESAGLHFRGPLRSRADRQPPTRSSSTSIQWRTGVFVPL
ncbi:MAG TPA: hypothetical protein PLL72_07640, partial [Burkholderiaceae bacterium]|nr:hypothetical protein [Burkholderiaceae bacterium]